MAKNKGFAALSIKQRRAVSSLGGRTAHKKGVAHVWTPEEARKFGKKGGLVIKKR